MIGPAPHDLALLHSYLDGAMNDADRAGFERRIASDPALGAELERLQAVDAMLRSHYSPPEIHLSLTPDVPVGQIGPRSKSTFLSGASPWRYALLAATLVLASLAWIWQFSQSRIHVRSMHMSAGEVHSNLLRKGYKPEFVCTTDEEFNKTIKDRFGQGLLIASAPNIELIGWAYADNYAGGVVSTKELVLMTRVDGRETTVFIDNLKNDRTINEQPPDAMRVFRRVVGDLVLYELTSASKPTLLDRAFDPDSK